MKNKLIRDIQRAKTESELRGLLKAYLATEPYYERGVKSLDKYGLTIGWRERRTNYTRSYNKNYKKSNRSSRGDLVYDELQDWAFQCDYF